ncbi:MAG: disulfide oxidoreductase [Acidimicrobiia bacterium]
MPTSRGIHLSVNTVSTFLAVGAIALSLLVLGIAGLWVVARVSAGASRALQRLADSVQGYGLWLAWFMAVVATLGSLYYSEVAGFTPCEYCWYQRIAMYPLAIILGIAAFRRDRAIRIYAIPVAAAGGVISAYHYMIQHFPSLARGTCDLFAPCSAAYVWKFDFVSIPFMALVAFASIVTALALDGPSARARRSSIDEVSDSEEDS